MADAHLAAFWDLENIHIPKGSDARLLVEELRKKVFPRTAFEISFKAYLDVSKISTETQRELERANVELVHVPNASKNGADLRIIQSVNDFVRLQSDRSAFVVLLTSDENFLPLASSLRKIKGVETSLVHSKQTNAALVDAFDRAYLWPGLTASKGRGVPEMGGEKEKSRAVLPVIAAKGGEANTSSGKGVIPGSAVKDKRDLIATSTKAPPKSGSKDVIGATAKAPKSDTSGSRDVKGPNKADPKADKGDSERREVSKNAKGLSSSDSDRHDAASRIAKHDPKIRGLVDGTARLDIQDRRQDVNAKGQQARPAVASKADSSLERRQARQADAAKPKTAPRKRKEQPKTFTCFKCEKSFDNGDKLAMHQSSTGHLNEHKCIECDRMFSSRPALVQHQATSGHSNLFECPRCDKEFSSEQALEQHMADTGHSELFECVECEREFTTEKGLEQHQTATGHTDGYMCGECERVFASEQAILMHRQSTGHVDGVYCGECDKEFKTQQALDSHQTDTGHSDKVACRVCDRVFASYDGLLQHQAATGHS